MLYNHSCCVIECCNMEGRCSLTMHTSYNVGAWSHKLLGGIFHQGLQGQNLIPYLFLQYLLGFLGKMKRWKGPWLAMASTRTKNTVIFGPNRLLDYYVPKALCLEGLYYNGQVQKFSMQRWIFKCHIHVFRM